MQDAESPGDPDHATPMPDNGVSGQTEEHPSDTEAGKHLVEASIQEKRWKGVCLKYRHDLCVSDLLLHPKS